MKKISILVVFALLASCATPQRTAVFVSVGILAAVALSGGSSNSDSIACNNGITIGNNAGVIVAQCPR